MDGPYEDLAGVYAVEVSTVVSSHSQTWTTMSSQHKNRESTAGAEIVMARILDF